MPPCSCSAASRLAPAGRRRPPLDRLPCSCCRLPAVGVRLWPPVPRCQAAGHQPTLPFGPSALRRSGLPTRLGTAVPPASLPPCLAPWCLPGSLLHCSAAHVAACLRARLLNCSVLTCCVGRYCSAAAVHQSIHLSGRCAAVRGASHPALRASGASLLDQLHCSPGSSALCDCAGYCVCLLSLICLG
jgi:hypothetical protein